MTSLRRAFIAAGLLGWFAGCVSDSLFPRQDAGAPGAEAGAMSGPDGAAAGGQGGGAGAPDAPDAGKDRAGGTGGPDGDVVPPSEAGTMADRGLPPPPPEARVVPNPLLSRGKPVAISSPEKNETLMTLTNGVYNDAGWYAPVPTTATIQLGAGPSQVLVRFGSATNPGFYTPRGMADGVPTDYTIDVSADGTTWTQAVKVTDNYFAERAHLVPFQGKSSLRVSVTRVDNPGKPRVFIDELDVHDASNGPLDSWLFIGDSISAIGYGRQSGKQPSFPEVTHQKLASFFPLMIDGGVGGTQTTYGLQHIDEIIAAFPDIHFWVIGWGTNEIAPTPTDYRNRMQMLIDKVKGAGHMPVLPHIPYQKTASNPQVMMFNAVLDDLVVKNGLVAGPDYFAWFMAHQDELADALHPNNTGCQSMHRLFAAAVAPIYAK